MAKTFTAPFAQTPDTWNATATTAFALTGAGSLADNTPANTVLLGTAGIDGALLTSVRAIPRATNTATMAVLFLRKTGDAAGIRRVLKSVTVPAQTVAAATGITDVDFGIATETTPFRLSAGDELYVGLGVTQTNGITFNANAMQF